MHLAILLVLAATTLAFGGVYPWAYVPLCLIAAGIGIAGLRRRGLPQADRPLAYALAAVAIGIALQLIPLPRSVVQAVSPGTLNFLGRFHLGFAQQAGALPLSIEPSATALALLMFMAFAVYLLGAGHFLQDDVLPPFIRGLILFAVPLCLFGIYIREHDNGLVYWFWRPQEGGGSGQFGPFVNRNHFAGWMIMAAPLALGYLFWLLEARRHAQAGERRWVAKLSSAGTNELFMTAGGLVVMFVAIAWTMSRSAWTGLACALVVFGLIVIRKERGDRRLRLGFIAVLTTLVMAGVLFRGPARMVAWYGDRYDIHGRIDAWRDGADLIRDFAWTGSGLNTYPTAMLLYQKRNRQLYVAQAHNDYLQLLAEGGALVMIPAAAALLYFVLGISRGLRTSVTPRGGYWLHIGATIGLIAMAVQELAEFSLQIPANTFLFCTLGAVALRPIAERRVLGSPEFVAMAKCRKCGSTEIIRSRTRNRWERWRKEITQKRPYRCHACNWRGWLADVPPVFSEGDVREAQMAMAPDPPNLKGTAYEREPPRAAVDVRSLDSFNQRQHHDDQE